MILPSQYLRVLWLRGPALCYRRFRPFFWDLLLQRLSSGSHLEALRRTSDTVIFFPCPGALWPPVQCCTSVCQLSPEGKSSLLLGRPFLPWVAWDQTVDWAVCAGHRAVCTVAIAPLGSQASWVKLKAAGKPSGLKGAPGKCVCKHRS